MYVKRKDLLETKQNDSEDNSEPITLLELRVRIKARLVSIALRSQGWLTRKSHGIASS
jgi:hypothetical protein